VLDFHACGKKAILSLRMGIFGRGLHRPVIRSQSALARSASGNCK
jgi:hypothetical protein